MLKDGTEDTLYSVNGTADFARSRELAQSDPTQSHHGRHGGGRRRHSDHECLLMCVLYRKNHGPAPFPKYECGGRNTWNALSTPGRHGKRIVEAFTQRALEDRWVNIVRRALRDDAGAKYGVVAGSKFQLPPRDVDYICRVRLLPIIDSGQNCPFIWSN